MKIKNKISKFLLVGFLPIFCLTSAVKINGALCSEPLRDEAESSLHRKVLSHHISVELDIKKHLLKAKDLMSVQQGKGDFIAFLNSEIPKLEVYPVNPCFIAFIAARLIFCGVSKSGWPISNRIQSFVFLASSEIFRIERLMWEILFSSFKFMHKELM